MFYPRLILPKLQKVLSTKENIILTGMRQVGKTTILRHLFFQVKSTNKVFLDLENPISRKIFEEENYDNIWNNLKNYGITNTTQAYIFLDEVQNLPEISRVVKYFYDHWDIKFILTGSSSYYLKNLFPESLAGRKLVFELFPLNFREFLIFKQIKPQIIKPFAKKAIHKNRIAYSKMTPYYQEFMEFGGFPRVVIEPDHRRKKSLLLEIFTSYFEKDAKNLSDFKDMSKLRDLILLLIPRIGSKMEISKLANSLSLSRETIYNYLYFLEQTYFVALINKFSTSTDRQTAGKQKLFLCDVGLAQVLGKISEGQAFEQSVFQNLRTTHQLNYFSKGDSNEIDFIIDKKVALEVKINPSKQDILHLNLRANALRLTKRYIISQEYSNKKEIILATDL